MPRWYQNVCFLPLQLRILAKKRPNLAQKWHFWPHNGIFGPLCLMPDQKSMQIRCPDRVSVTWISKLLLFPINIEKWPKTAKFGPKYDFLGTFLASSFGALLVGGCGAWAVSRKTPIHFMVF